MKYFIFLVFIFWGDFAYCQNPKPKTIKQSKKNSKQEEAITTQATKLSASFLDSLKNFKDTVVYSQIIGLRKLNFLSGSIYFAGANYEKVAILRLNSESNSVFNKYFDRCGPGSKLSFENVVWKDEKGMNLGPLTKLFILK